MATMELMPIRWSNNEQLASLVTRFLSQTLDGLHSC